MDQELIRLLHITGALAKIHLGSLLDGPREAILSRRLDEIYDSAMKLQQEKRYAEALPKYLDVFERSSGVSGWGGVRLSYLFSHIARMDYPPARQALFDMRQSRECQMLAGINDWKQIHEWVSINRYLVDNNILKFYEELKWLELDVSDICFQIRHLAMKDFVNAKLYGEYGRADVKRSLTEFHLMTETFGPSGIFTKADSELMKSAKESMIRSDALAFEIAIALGETDMASEMVTLLVELDPAATSFIELWQRATHAGIAKWQKELASRAALRLSKAEYAKIERGRDGVS